MRAWHGLDRIIEGMAASPHANTLKLVVVGDGPVRADLEALAQKLGIASNVRFTGLVQPEEVPAIVTTFDIALQPGATPYASPLKIFDYMAAGCAIVAPRQPNILEILQDGTTAELFDPKTPGALWNAVETLIADPAHRNALGLAARAELEQKNYTWAGNALRVAQIAETL